MTNPTTMTAEPNLPFVDFIREFDAPVAAVFRAHTDADLFARWNGPGTMAMEIIEFNASPGGRWKYVSRGSDGDTFGFRGVFHTVETNTLIIQTFEFDGAPGAAGISATTFEEVDGRTRISAREVYPSVEARDAAVAGGMEYGVNESYERLDEMLAS